MKPVKMIIAGAGGRGHGYATYAKEHPELLQIVGVAEPRAFQREQMVELYGVPSENVFSDWEEMAGRARFADAVLISTQDAMHVAPAVEFAAKGYHILLEKPMAPSAEGCRAIVNAVEKAGVLFAVCHVMRYTDYTQKFVELLKEGAVGEIASIQHLEPVGFWHQAHSFVRGSWRNEAESSFMLLAKSCHDIDWLTYVVGEPIVRVSSFGNLFHFRKEHQPVGAGDRCLDCGESVERNCPYSAKRFYLKAVREGNTGWPVNVLTNELTEDGVMKALREGPYGRCVFACDNDVVDHQVVNMEFGSGATGSFTMTAFDEGGGRKTRVFGTRGYMEGDGDVITVYDFLTEKKERYEVNTEAGTILGGHGGGDYKLMKAFVAAVGTNDRSLVLTGSQETLQGHLAVFAAEAARKEGRVIDTASFEG